MNDSGSDLQPSVASQSSMASRGMRIGVAPHRFTPSTFVTGAVSYMTTRQDTPNFLAAYAHAWAALPALTVIKPRRSWPAGRLRAAAKKPRTLKLPVGWRHSSFSSAPSTGTKGVRTTCGRERPAAALIRSMVIMPGIIVKRMRGGPGKIFGGQVVQLLGAAEHRSAHIDRRVSEERRPQQRRWAAWAPKIRRGSPGILF